MKQYIMSKGVKKMISKKELLERYNPDAVEIAIMQEIDGLIEENARSGKVNEITKNVQIEQQRSKEVTKEEPEEDKVR